MRAATGLLLLFASAVFAGPEGRRAASDFSRAFGPERPDGSRTAALREAARVLEAELLQAFDDAYEITAREIRRALFESEEAVKKAKELEGQIDAVVSRETQRAREEGRPPDLRVSAALVQAAEAARRQAETLQRRIEAEHALRDQASEALGGWLGALPADESAAAYRVLERDHVGDSDFGRRIYYAKALAKTSQPPASRLLYQRLTAERDERVLPVVIDAAAAQAGEGCLDFLLSFLADERWPIRVAAIAAIGRIGSEKAVPALIDRLAVEDGRLRGDLRAALTAITKKDFGVSAERWRRWWEEERAAAASKGADEGPADGGGAAAADGPKTFYGIEILSKRVIFVIDVSNSMNSQAGEDPQRRKIDVAKRELENAILGLPDDGAFNIVLYHHDVWTWRKGMVDSERKNRREAVEFVREIVADGNTNIFDALDRAFHMVGIGARDKHYELGADTIFLLSDGVPNRGRIIDSNAILAEVGRLNELRRVKIHTVGVGEGHDAAFMRALAASSGGTYVAR